MTWPFVFVGALWLALLWWMAETFLDNVGQWRRDREDARVMTESSDDGFLESLGIDPYRTHDRT